MVKGKTESGFEFELEESVIDNMELVDALSESEEEDPLAVSKVCLLLLGKEQRKKLYDCLRTKEGRVPIKEVSKNIIEIFSAFGKKGKN